MYLPTLLLSQEPVDWVDGDNIVIAPTSKDGNETEVSDLCTCGLTTWCNVPIVLYLPFDITYIRTYVHFESRPIILSNYSHVQVGVVQSVGQNGYRINLVNALKYTHFGITETFDDGQFIEIR